MEMVGGNRFDSHSRPKRNINENDRKRLLKATMKGLIASVFALFVLQDWKGANEPLEVEDLLGNWIKACNQPLPALFNDNQGGKISWTLLTNYSATFVNIFSLLSGGWGWSYLYRRVMI